MRNAATRGRSHIDVLWRVSLIIIIDIVNLFILNSTAVDTLVQYSFFWDAPIPQRFKFGEK